MPETSAYASRALASKLRLLAEKARKTALMRYRPYSRQAEFHRAGAASSERLLMAPNKIGKTWCAAAETAYHLTGEYPSWWEGRRFDEPVLWIVASETGKLCRDGAQAYLFGAPVKGLGEGMIPGHAIMQTSPGGHLREAYDFARVRHASGRGDSICYFRSYDQGRQRIQSYNAHGVWCDEEPDVEWYTEALTRTNYTGGMVYITATPLMGATEVIGRFWPSAREGCALTMMTLEDAEHYSAERRAEIRARYSESERRSRAEGLPSLGSGAVFPVTREQVSCAPFEIPPDWPIIGGIDFGYDHPTAAVKLAHDRDSDTVYVIAAYRVRQKPIYEHAAALKPWGPMMPWAWPHDGLQHDPSNGIQYAELYSQHGLNMRDTRAMFENGSISLNAGLDHMLERMITGRMKVWSHLEEWWQEFGGYHRKDGQVVKLADDLMSATRYALMDLRFAESDRMSWAFKSPKRIWV